MGPPPDAAPPLRTASVPGAVFWVFAVLLLATAAATRLWTLDVAPTYDTHATYHETEQTSLETLRKYFTFEYARTLNEVEPVTIAEAPHLTFPAYYALNKAYLAVAPEGHTAARALPAFLSWLTVVLLMALAARHISTWAALVVGVLAVTSPLLQYHGSYIRFYAALTFFSAWSLWAVLALAERVRGERELRRGLAITGASLLLWFPLSIHASGALSVFVGGVILLLRVWPRLKFGERAYALGLNLVLATPLLVNTAVFLVARSRNAALMPSDYVMSTSALSFLASLLFNFNGLVFLTIAFAFVVCRGLRNELYVPYAIALLLTFVGVTIQPTLFRPDYLLSLLPLTYLLFGDAVEQLGMRLGGTRLARGTLALVVVCVVTFTLPSFVSNVFIDQDRLDYRRAMHDLEQRTDAAERVLVYTHSPLNFPPAPERIRIANLTQEGEIDEAAFDRVFYVIGWRREGFQKKFLALVDTSTIQRTTHLVHISGKNRLDARDNLLFFFEKPRGR